MGRIMRNEPQSIGEVIRYRRPLVDGKVLLLALTAGPHPCVLDWCTCEPAEEIRQTEALYRELWDHAHAVTRPSSSERAADAEGRHLRLIG